MNDLVYLGLDTASHDVTVGAVRGAQCVHTQLELGETSTHLLTAVGELLERLRAKPSDLGAVACAAGPGSFTGIRIGLATALGLTEGLDLPAAAVSNHWAQAWAAQRSGASGAICSLLPSHGGQWSLQRYVLERGLRTESAIETVAEPPTAETLVTSQGACRRFLKETEHRSAWLAPLATSLAFLASTADSEDTPLNWDRSSLLQPVYAAGPAVATSPRVPASAPASE